MASTSTSDAARRSSKRVSTLPSLPKAPTSIDPSAIVANHAVLTGLYPITIGPRAVLHPYAKIVSGDGPIEIGEGCIIWEKAVVGSGSAAEDNANGTEKVKKMVLGPNVVVESGATVEAESVGEGTIIESFSRIGDGASVGKVTVPPINRKYHMI
jgi:dynactin 6